MYQLISLRMSRLRNWLSQEGAKRHKCRRMIFPHEINFKKKVKKWKCLPTSKVFRKTAVCKVPLCSAQLPGKVCSAGSMQWVLQDARCRWHQVRSPFSQLTVLLHGIHARSRHCMSSLQGVTGQIYPWQYYFRCHHEVSHHERSQISCICSPPQLWNIITCHIAQSSGKYPSWVHNTFHLKSLKINHRSDSKSEDIYILF